MRDGLVHIRLVGLMLFRHDAYDGFVLLFHDVHDETKEGQHDVLSASISKS
jgi:hypothetical protein